MSFASLWGKVMKLRFVVPVVALAMLAACGSDADSELADAALSADEASGEAADDAAVMPRPGQYATTQELVELDLPGVPEAQLPAVRAAFAEGAADATSYCVAEEMTRERWLSSMTESNCTAARFDVEGNQVNAVLNCTAEGGINGRVALSGTGGRDGSDMVMSFTQAIPGMGDGTIRMRVKATRTGDCAG